MCTLGSSFSVPSSHFLQLIDLRSYYIFGAELKMEALAHRAWMYNRLRPDRRGYTTKFLKGAEEFIGFACQQQKYLVEGVIWCPCKRCKNERHLTPDVVNVHIHKKGFKPGYWHWTFHGEKVSHINVDIDTDTSSSRNDIDTDTSSSRNDIDTDTSSSSNQQGYEHVNRYEDMVFDATVFNREHHFVNDEEPSNMEVAKFSEMLNSVHRPLRPERQNASEFSTAGRMRSLKHNISQTCLKSKHNKMEMSNSKKYMQPIKKLKKKKFTQSHIIPSDTFQAYTNKVTKPQPNQHQPPPQPQFIQPQSLPRSRPPQQFTPSQPQHQPPPQSTQSIRQPRPRSTQPQSRPTQFIPQPTHSIPQPRSHPTRPRSTRSLAQPRSTQSIPQSLPRFTQYLPPPQPQPQLQPRSLPIPTQVVRMQEYPMGNAAQSSSSSLVSGEDDRNKILILPEGDGFDKHKLVVSEIASIIRSNLEEGKPSWKKISRDTRDEWFKLFQKKFTWPPECKDKVRRNFEKRGSAKMIQLMQEARKELDQKPTWMRDVVWRQLKAHWKSSTFKKKSTINRRNGKVLDGASLHTGGSIPHRLHWKRMKEEKGTDPSLTDFYLRTHQKKDQSWVGVHAKAAYDKFEKKKQELTSQTFAPGEDEPGSQPCINMPSDLNIWIDAVGKKGKKIFGLGSASETLTPTLTNTNSSEEIVSLRSQIHTLNASLQKQEQEKLQMKEELNKTNRQVAELMEHLGFAASSSRPPSSPQKDKEVVDDSDEFSDHGE